MAEEAKGGEGAKAARSLLDKLKLEGALSLAAAEAHPGWESDGRNIMRTADDAPETPEALVEWFQTTHPQRAREIEESFNQ